jgi:hypothetical protein
LTNSSCARCQEALHVYFKGLRVCGPSTVVDSPIPPSRVTAEMRGLAVLFLGEIVVALSCYRHRDERAAS